MAEHRKADDVLHEKSGELFIAGGGRGDEDGSGEIVGSRVSVCSSTSNQLMIEDDHGEAESSLVLAEHQDDLSPLLANLSVRTGLSKFYEGKSRAFTHLSDEIDLKDVPKKTTNYITRMKADRGHLFGTRGKTIAKNKKIYKGKK